MLVYNDFRNDARVLKEARTLTEAGHRVTLVAVEGPGLAHRERVAGFDVVRVPRAIALTPWDRLPPLESACKVAASKSAGANASDVAPGEAGGPRPPLARRVVNRLRGLATKVKGLAKRVLRRPMSPLRGRARFRALAHYAGLVLEQDPPDVVHAHDLNTLWAGDRLARRFGARLVYDSHELFVERNSQPPLTRLERYGWARLERRLIKRCDAVITVNVSIAQELSKRYSVAQPEVVLNAPVHHEPSPGDRTLLREALGLEAGQRLMVYAGALTFNRGLEPLIRSLALLPGWVLVLMGPGKAEFREGLERVALEAGVGSRLRFYGPVEPDEVVRWLSGADLGAAPIRNVCLSYYLCLPNKLFEYMMAGLPMIASDLPEMKRVVLGLGVGRVFDPEDPGAIARAVESVFADEREVAEMRRRALEGGREMNWAAQERVLRKIYERLEALRSGARGR
jgi:glycosyltransferase involved in cell wall biosynthesis